MVGGRGDGGGGGVQGERMMGPVCLITALSSGFNKCHFENEGQETEKFFSSVKYRFGIKTPDL